MKNRFEVNTHADRSLALASYQQLAANYDATCYLIEPIRLKAIAALNLKLGQTVIDIASGTGKSLPGLCQQVGPTGRVIAVEQSPEMAALSQQRVAQLGIANAVHLISPVEEAVLSGVQADAAFFCYTHDVLRNPAALKNIMSALRPGARIVIAGFKAANGWASVFNPWFKYRARGYLSTFEGLDAPWSHLLAWVPDLKIEAEYFLKSGYLATGFAPQAVASNDVSSRTGGRS